MNEEAEAGVAPPVERARRRRGLLLRRDAGSRPAGAGRGRAGLDERLLGPGLALLLALVVLAILAGGVVLVRSGFRLVTKADLVESSTELAATNKSTSVIPSAGTTEIRAGFPSVSVPVLSTISVSTFSAISIASALRINTPDCAPRPTP